MTAIRVLFSFTFVLISFNVFASDVGPIGKKIEVLSDPYILGSWTHLYEVYPSRIISRGGDIRGLSHRPVDVPSITYSLLDTKYSIDEYIERNELTSLLVLHDGEIAYEGYYKGTNENTLFTSWSMAKSFTSTLVGLLLDDGVIASTDDLAVSYVPELWQSGYYDATLRDLMQMSAGVDYKEDYDSLDNLEGRAWIDSLIEQSLPLNQTILWFDKKLNPPGTVFNYASLETQVVGWVVNRSSGRTLSELVSERIWQKIGAEHDANWALDRPGGMEIASCCINATTRDYGRFGLLFMNNGRVGDEQVIPKKWIEIATKPDPQRSYLHPGNIEASEPLGYQHFWWLWPDDAAFIASGYGGQRIYINPQKRVVIVQTAVWRNDMAGKGKEETISAIMSIVEALDSR